MSDWKPVRIVRCLRPTVGFSMTLKGIRQVLKIDGWMNSSQYEAKNDEGKTCKIHTKRDAALAQIKPLFLSNILSSVISLAPKLLFTEQQLIKHLTPLAIF